MTAAAAPNWSQTGVRSKSEFEHWAAQNAPAQARRRQIESELEQALPEGSSKTYLGFCCVCNAQSHFVYDRQYSNGIRINWRERLVCTRCGLANRLRFSVQVLEMLLNGRREPSIYLTEQVTPLAAALQRRRLSIACSEFIGAEEVGGRMDAKGIRHEDLTQLSFADAQFDGVLTFDVLEHIPDYRSALKEMRRVTKDGGFCIITVPFSSGSEFNLVRARRGLDGGIEHLMPAEYHGDPVWPDRGVLSYYTFGWELIEDLRACGYKDAMVQYGWSAEYANLGPEQPIVIASA